MKSITITGKRNIDNLSNINQIKEKPLRLETLNVIEYSHYQQVGFINMLFLSHSFKEEAMLLKMIQTKIKGYHQQDVKKKLDTPIITLKECISKLFNSNLKCDYCFSQLKLIYLHVREQDQWTLERIDNSIGHSNDNTMICCLKCNLQRRNKNIDTFTFTKQYVLKKT